MKPPLLHIIALMLCLMACRQSEMSSINEINQFVNDPDNNLIQHEESSGYKIAVSYRPTDLLVEQELGNETNEQNLHALRAKYSAYYYFILSVSRQNAEALNPANGLDQYSELVQTMSFRMGEFVSMTTSKGDTISVADFILNRTFGMSTSTDVLFVFNKQKSKDSDWVQFNLNEFGLGTGNQRFRFRVNDLERSPRLRFNIAKQ
jgi:hypothetical protein